MTSSAQELSEGKNSFRKIDLGFAVEKKSNKKNREITIISGTSLDLQFEKSFLD